ncbi:MAG: ABC transporter substrate-binding protein, partial [Promethearchaeota archaeon]
VINMTYRQAISYATNYTYILKNIYEDQVVRNESPVPEGIMYHNPNVHSADMNLTRARQILIDAGLAGSLNLASSDSDWEAVAAGETPIATYNYSYNEGNQYRTDLGTLMQNNLKEIGIAVTMNGITWGDYLGLLFGTPEKLGIYMLGWGPDYNDPSNYINPLFSNTSSSNGAQVNDPYLQDLMMQGLTETNATHRKELYYEMQRFIVEELMPWLFLYVPLSQSARRDTVKDLPRNPMGKLYFYPVTWCDIESDSTDIITGQPSEGGIPGYSAVLIGIVAISMMAILYKKRH